MQIKKESVRNKIMQCAKAEFLDKGFENVSVRSIAKKSGIASGTIYTYFEDKDALFKAIVEPAAERLLGSMNKTMNGFSSAPGGTAALEDVFSTKVGKAAFTRLFDLLYPDMDEYRLLLCKSKGSGMEGFKENLVETYTKFCLPLLETAAEKCGTGKKFSPVSIRLIFSLFLIVVEEIISKEIPREEADGYLEELAGLVYGAWYGLIQHS